MPPGLDVQKKINELQRAQAEQSRAKFLIRVV